MPEYTVNGDPLVSVVMFRNLPSAVTLFAAAAESPLDRTAETGITLSENTCLTSNVEGPFVGLRIKRILRQRLQDCAGICRQAAEDRAGVVD